MDHLNIYGTITAHNSSHTNTNTNTNTIKCLHD